MKKNNQKKIKIMYELDKIYEYLTQKNKDFDSILSSADDKLRDLESKSSRVSTPLNFHFLLRIRFGRRYKKLDERLSDAELVYDELVRKQGFMKPILQATDPILKDLLESKKLFDEWYQDAKNFVDSLDDIEKQFDYLDNRIQRVI